MKKSVCLVISNSDRMTKWQSNNGNFLQNRKKKIYLMCHTFVLTIELWQRRSSGATHAGNTETPKQLGKGASGENF